MKPYYEQDGEVCYTAMHENNNMWMRMRANCERVNEKWPPQIYKWAQPQALKKDQSPPGGYIVGTKAGVEDEAGKIADRNKAGQRVWICSCQGSRGQGAVEVRTRHCGRDDAWTKSEARRDRSPHQRRSFGQSAQQLVCLPQSVSSQRSASVRSSGFSRSVGTGLGCISGGKV